MFYPYFIKRAKDLTISQLDNGVWYLEPEWFDIICDEVNNHSDSLEELTDTYVTSWSQIEDILRLEVERRNILRDNRPFIMDWLFDLITTQVEPAVLKEETEYVQKVIEYMKHNHEEKGSSTITADPASETPANN